MLSYNFCFVSYNLEKAKIIWHESKIIWHEKKLYDIKKNYRSWKIIWTDLTTIFTNGCPHSLVTLIPSWGARVHRSSISTIPHWTDVLRTVMQECMSLKTNLERCLVITFFAFVLRLPLWVTCICTYYLLHGPTESWWI